MSPNLALSAISGVLTGAKLLYDYYARHQQNRRILDILTNFSTNLDVCLQRLRAREATFGHKPNPMLESIAADFQHAHDWLQLNDHKLRSVWSALETGDRLADLDNKLMKSFASKMSVALFEAVQDTRYTTTQISMKLDTLQNDLPSSVASLVKESTAHSIREALKLLREEEIMARGGGAGTGGGGPVQGFQNQEAEKIISLLIDQLTAAEEKKANDERRRAYLSQVVLPAAHPTPQASSSTSPLQHTQPQRYAAPHPIHQHSDPIPYQRSHTLAAGGEPGRVDPVDSLSRSLSVASVSSVSSYGSDVSRFSFGGASQATSDTSFPTVSPATERWDSPNTGLGGSGHNHPFPDSAGGARGIDRSRTPQPSPAMRDGTTASVQPPQKPRGFAAGVIGFNAVDPITGLELVDPVVVTDGRILDRLTLILHPNLMDDHGRKVELLAPITQLREAIFLTFPERRKAFEERRKDLMVDTAKSCVGCSHVDMPDVLFKLDHILSFDTDATEFRIRRALIKFRLRDLKSSLEDLSQIVDSTSTSIPYSHKLLALKYRAMVHSECHDPKSSIEDLNTVLAEIPDDFFALSLRASNCAVLGRTGEAFRDLNDAVLNFELRESQGSRGANEKGGNGFGGGAGADLAQSIEDDTKDLQVAALGWARLCLGDFPSAVSSFTQAISAYSSLSSDPQFLASKGLSEVYQGLENEGLELLDRAIRDVVTFKERRAQVVLRNGGSRASGAGANSVRGKGKGVDKDELPIHAYGPFFLRGMARYKLRQFAGALEDFETSRSLRPTVVKDTGEFREVLGVLRAETGDKEGASQDFDWAVALRPEGKYDYNRQRETYGLGG